jgi:hypothetical protein
MNGLLALFGRVIVGFSVRLQKTEELSGDSVFDLAFHRNLMSANLLHLA